MNKKVNISIKLCLFLFLGCLAFLNSKLFIQATSGTGTYRIAEESTGEGFDKVTDNILLKDGDSRTIYMGHYDESNNFRPLENVTWRFPDNQEIATFKSQGKGGIKLSPKLPGTTKLEATGRPVGETNDITVTVYVTVPVEIKKSGASKDTLPRIVNLYTETQQDDIILQMQTTATGSAIVKYNLELKNIGKLEDIAKNLTGGAITKYITFISSNPNVATVSTDGAVTAVGAGYAEITVVGELINGAYTNTTDMIKVFVMPRASEKKESDLKFTIRTIETGTGASVTSDFAFFHDALEQDQLCWTIEKTKMDWSDGKEIVNTFKGTTSGYISLNISDEIVGSVSGSGKAGYYIIRGFIKEEYKKHKGERKSTLGDEYYLTIYLIINPRLADATKTMSVGDSYDIFSAFNIAYEDWKIHFQEEDKDGNPSWHTLITATYGKYLEIDEETGIITAKAATYFKEKKPELTNDVNDLKIVFTHLATGEKYTLTIRIVDELLLNKSNIEIFVGGVDYLWVENSVNDATLPTWSVKDKKIVSLSEDGTVTGLAEGETDIIVKQRDVQGVYKRAVCHVKVRKTVTNITVAPDKIEMEVGEFKTLKATLSPGDLDRPNIKWISSDPKIADVVDQNLKAATIEGKSSGVTTILALNEKNLAVGACKVTIEEKITSIKFPQTDITVKLSLGNLQLKPSYTPATATATVLDWKSTVPKVATVDGNGLVTLKKAGTTSIIVSSKYNPAASATCNITVIQDSTGLVLDTTNKTIKVGESFRITYYLNPKGTTDTVSWSVLGKGGAVTVKDGLVTGKKAGTAQILAKTSSGMTATCEVTVTQEAAGIKLDTTSLSLLVGEVYYAKATITPNDTTDSKITWTSQNAKVATVTDDGKITAVNPGTTTITVKTKNNQLATMEVTVTAKVTGITLNYTEKTIVVKNKFKLVAIVEPKGASNKDVTWESSNNKVATVTDGGTVKGVSGGTAIITCTTNDGEYKASCVVTVKEAVTKIKLNKTSLKLGKGKTFLLKAKVKSTGATNQKLKWSSSKNSVVSVDDRGKIRGLKAGKAVITCKATDGSGAEATCEVRVIKEVSSIKLNKTMITLLEGRTTKLTATIKPKNATYKQPKWSIDDEKVALVDSNGQVTALKAGTAKIKVTAKDNSGKKAYCVVNVLANVPATSIVAAQKDLVMVVGATAMVSVSVSPATTTDKISYTCDNTNVAVVDAQSGKVRAIKPGTATILVTASGGKQATVNVTVVGLNFSSYSMEQYDTLQLRVEGVTEGVSWDITDSSVATISNTGLVSAKKGGTTTAVATVNGAKLTCRITVRDIQ